MRARSSKTFLFTLAAALACGLLLYSASGPAAASGAAAQPSQTGLVDVTASGAAAQLGAAAPASITPDGRFVAFTSTSNDLVPNDGNNTFVDRNVFVRDRRAGRTVLVSANVGGTGTGNGPSSSPVITPDGRYVAFLSSADNLTPAKPSTFVFQDVYLRDLQAGTTTLVSQTPDGRMGNGRSGDGSVLSVSDDGRYVCFVSNASNLVSGLNTSTTNIFVRDVKEGVTRLASVNQAGTGGNNNGARNAVMTPDGRYVAFRSLGSDLAPNDANSNDDIFLRDMQAGTTKLVSARPDGGSGNGGADPRNNGDLAVSPDGRFVLFTSAAGNLVAGDNNGTPSIEGADVFLRDTVAGSTRLVSVNQAGTASGNGSSGLPAMTPDGRFVVFLSAAEDLVANDTNKVQDVFVRDMQANTTALVTANTSGAPAGVQNLICEGSPLPMHFFLAMDRPTISSDGRYVAFRSAAADLTATPDTNCFDSQTVKQDGYDIFVRDTQAGATRLVSANMTGESAGAHRSQYPTITPDGRHVLFASEADDLTGNDANGPTQDLFVNVNLPAAGQVRFAQHALGVAESAGQAVLTVTRTPGATGPAAVSYTTLGGSASGGSEFTPTSGTLDFAPGEESKQFVVPVSDDAVDEEDENFFVRITDESGGAVGEPALASVVIADDDAAPRLSVSDASVGEGDGGTADMVFVVTLSEPSQRTITARVVTQNGTATGGSTSQPGADFEPLDGTYTFLPGSTRGLLHVNVWPDATAEPDETFTVVFSNPTAVEIEDGVGVGTIVDDDGATFTKVQFAAPSYTVSEKDGRLDVQVTRTGDLSGPSSVSYWTLDFLNASSRTDYAPLTGFLSFAPGESSKTIPIFVTDDALSENEESFMLLLFSPRGATSGANSAVMIGITSDDAANGPSPARPEGSTAFFVRQHYRDFLGRDPDPSGLAFWTNEIESCGTNQQCREVKRINVSAAFFLSIEFQETGYLVYKTYKAAYGNMAGRPVPVPHFWFAHDAQQIGHDVVVNQGEWRGQLEQNKRDYFDYFVRDEFFNLVYPASMTPAEFVGGLDANAGGVLAAEERASLASELAAGTKTRAQVLRAVAENAELSRREFNRAFVLMQYFGYLRRNPDDYPNFNYSGYNFWLGKLDDFNGDYIAAEMVKAFISSDEYLKRFGQ